MMTNGFGLGRIPSPIDARDYKLSNYMPWDLGDLSGEKLWSFNTSPLDQGDHPWCVGFGGADWCINVPIEDDYTNADGKRIYDLCKIMDLEPGIQNGSTVRTLAKVLQQLGRIKNYAFAASVDEITYWILNKGPVIIGTDWTTAMFTPDENNIIHPDGKIEGGHYTVINGKTSNELYRIHNSWDLMWGINGEAFISIADFAGLFTNNGEAMTAVELPLSATVEKDSCLTSFLKLFGIGV